MVIATEHRLALPLLEFRDPGCAILQCHCSETISFNRSLLSLYESATDSTISSFVNDISRIKSKKIDYLQRTFNIALRPLHGLKTLGKPLQYLYDWSDFQDNINNFEMKLL